MRLTPKDGRSEQGAVAIIAAMSALLLFAIGAIAVDLGNGFARKRDVQSQVDFSALAGGSELPADATPSIDDPQVKLVVDYLNMNQPQDDDGGGCLSTKTCVTIAQMVNADTADGEVYYAKSGQELRVVAPPALVRFGLAAALGFSQVEVNAEATVALRSPGRMLPFFLPRNCLKGPVDLKSNTGGEPGNVNLTFDPPSGTGGSIPSISDVEPSIVTFGSTTTTITLTGKNFGSTPRVDFFRESDNDRFPTDQSESVEATYVPATLPKDTNDYATLTVPSEVANRPGYWQVRLKNDAGWSKTFERIKVDTPPQENGCGVSATGDFGFLHSPRAGVTQQADAMAANIATGIDHTLAIFKGTLPPDLIKQDSCNGLGSTPYPGAILDVVENREKLPNCVSIQTGFNSGDALTPGLITGGSASGTPFKGLLDKKTLDNCNRFQESDSRAVLSRSINDDVLSCFLPEGTTVGQVTGKTIGSTAKNIVSSRIFDSPRFAVVPVIDEDTNPQNGFYPIVQFWPVFITDETPNSAQGSSFASSNNGVTLNNSGNKVSALTVIPIHPDALPETADSSGSGTIPWLGSGTKVILMIN